ncbi:hypothetical protein ACQ4M3_07430 [Leptolyngbya sp. AN03gr2]|uniref:hypothetical protein n=1 Tax=unclassified Leptolyngbya TaxID=2650499 RepID=UPI003D314463
MKWHLEQPIGLFGAWFYQTGWNHSTTRNLSSLEHLLLSVFFHYRQGFRAGSTYKIDLMVEQLRNHH